MVSSNCLSIKPNCVFTSPIPVDIFSISVGIWPATVLKLSCNDSSCSPVAPVAVVILSKLSSNSLNAAIEAAPIPMIGAVKPTVIFLPTDFILSPAFSILANFSAVLTDKSPCSFKASLVLSNADRNLFSPVSDSNKRL